MKVTLSVIKADIGSIGGHMAPSRHLLDIVKGEVAQLTCDLDLVIDHCVSFTGDGIVILLTHTRGIGDPGAFNLPLYLAFCDPMNTPGLLLSSKLAEGFRFVVMDVSHTEGDRVIELCAPENLYDIATLLRDNERYVVESVREAAQGGYYRAHGDIRKLEGDAPSAPAPAKRKKRS